MTKFRSFPPGEFFTIGAVAKLCRRDITTIRRYEKQGLIPPPKRRNSRGWRVYSFDETHAIVLGLRRVAANEIKMADLAEFIRSRTSHHSQ